MNEMANLGALNSPLGKYPRKSQLLMELWGGCCFSLGMDALEQRVPVHPCAGQTDSPGAAKVQQCQSSLLTRAK